MILGARNSRSGSQYGQVMVRALFQVVDYMCPHMMDRKQKRSLGPLL